MGGPKNAAGYADSFSTVCTKDWGKRAYEHRFAMSIQYNCLTAEPAKVGASPDPEYAGALASYKAESEKISAELAGPGPSEPSDEGIPPVYASDANSETKTIRTIVLSVSAVLGAALICIAVFMILRSRRRGGEAAAGKAAEERADGKDE